MAWIRLGTEIEYVATIPRSTTIKAHISFLPRPPTL